MTGIFSFYLLTLVTSAFKVIGVKIANRSNVNSNIYNDSRTFNETCGVFCITQECFNETGICKECSRGFFGPVCDKTCPQTCTNYACDRETGFCNSCPLGYRGDFCQDMCISGFYGSRCNQVCSPNCRRGACHYVTGVCLHGCREGFYTARCGITCPKGTYGRDCLANCPITCLNGSARCHAATGDCLDGCLAGFHGPRCSNVCPVGKYGENCNLVCNTTCQKQECNAFSGHCYSCVPGKTGLFCELNATSAEEQDKNVLRMMSLEILDNSKLVFSSVLGFIGLGILTWILVGLVMFYKHRWIVKTARRSGQRVPDWLSRISPWRGNIANLYGRRRMYTAHPRLVVHRKISRSKIGQRTSEGKTSSSSYVSTSSSSSSFSSSKRDRSDDKNTVDMWTSLSEGDSLKKAQKLDELDIGSTSETQSVMKTSDATSSSNLMTSEGDGNATERILPNLSKTTYSNVTSTSATSTTTSRRRGRLPTTKTDNMFIYSTGESEKYTEIMEQTRSSTETSYSTSYSSSSSTSSTSSSSSSSSASSSSSSYTLEASSSSSSHTDTLTLVESDDTSSSADTSLPPVRTAYKDIFLGPTRILPKLRTQQKSRWLTNNELLKQSRVTGESPKLDKEQSYSMTTFDYKPRDMDRTITEITSSSFARTDSQTSSSIRSPPPSVGLPISHVVSKAHKKSVTWDIKDQDTQTFYDGTSQTRSPEKPLWIRHYQRIVGAIKDLFTSPGQQESAMTELAEIPHREGETSSPDFLPSSQFFLTRLDKWYQEQSKEVIGASGSTSKSPGLTQGPKTRRELKTSKIEETTTETSRPTSSSLNSQTTSTSRPFSDYLEGQTTSTSIPTSTFLEGQIASTSKPTSSFLKGQTKTMNRPTSTSFDGQTTTTGDSFSSSE